MRYIPQESRIPINVIQIFKASPSLLLNLPPKADQHDEEVSDRDVPSKGSVVQVDAQETESYHGEALEFEYTKLEFFFFFFPLKRSTY